MEQNDKYYSLREAEEIRQTYSSWIGKKAYTKNSRQEVLKSIIIKPVAGCQEIVKNTFAIDFEFEDRNRCSSREFMAVNGLLHNA